jgi:hypothetical protein
MAEKGPPIITHLGGQHFHFEAGGIGSYQTLGEGRCPTFSRQTTRRRCLHAYGFSPELNLQPVYVGTRNLPVLFLINGQPSSQIV